MTPPIQHRWNFTIPMRIFRVTTQIQHRWNFIILMEQNRDPPTGPSGDWQSTDIRANIGLSQDRTGNQPCILRIKLLHLRLFRLPPRIQHRWNFIILMEQNRDPPTGPSGDWQSTDILPNDSL